MPEEKRQRSRVEFSKRRSTKKVTTALPGIRCWKASKLLANESSILYRLQGSVNPHLDNCTAKAKKIQNRPVAGESEAESESKEEQEAEEELVSYGSGRRSKDRKQRRKKKQLVSGSSDEKIKLQRAQGGCPGTIRRRRTWQAAKSNGERQAGIDPLISEWGNPADEESVTVR